MTTADIVSEIMGYYGDHFLSQEGIKLEEICKFFCADHRKIEGKTAFDFYDGSVITIDGGAWDIGFPNCFCFAGGLHYCDLNTENKR